jgi:hypothetical protein
MSERGAVVGGARRDGRADVLGQHAARARLEHVEAAVRDDPVHPRAEARARLVGRERSPRLELRVLQRIVGVVKSAEHAVGVRVQLAAERLDQRTKRLLVAAAGGFDQELEIAR